MKRLLIGCLVLVVCVFSGSVGIAEDGQVTLRQELKKEEKVSAMLFQSSIEPALNNSYMNLAVMAAVTEQLKPYSVPSRPITQYDFSSADLSHVNLLLQIQRDASERKKYWDAFALEATDNPVYQSTRARIKELRGILGIE